MRRVAGPDDGRQAELAADDRGMRRASAVIGDDRRGPLHDRNPVGVGRLGHQNRAVDEAADVARTIDQADAPGDDRIADAQARDKLPALRLDPVGS